MITGNRLRVIRYASWFHFAFGASILIFPLLSIELPNPFGSLEAYLQYMSAWKMATMFVVVGLSSRLAFHLHDRAPWLLIVLVVPQQFILLWGALWGIFMLAETALVGHEFDARGWLGACQLGGLSWYHGREVLEIWARAWGRAHEPSA